MSQVAQVRCDQTASHVTSLLLVPASLLFATEKQVRSLPLSDTYHRVSFSRKAVQIKAPPLFGPKHQPRRTHQLGSGMMDGVGGLAIL